MGVRVRYAQAGSRSPQTWRDMGGESRAAPGRAGDGTRDRREARVDRPLPIEALAGHGDGMALALVIANEHGETDCLPGHIGLELRCEKERNFS